MTTALIYPPGTFATTEELVEIARAATRHGGTYATHMRDEGKDLIAAITEAITIGEQAGLPVEIFHLKAAWQPGWCTLMAEAGRTIDAARAVGLGHEVGSLEPGKRADVILVDLFKPHLLPMNMPARTIGFSTVIS